MMVLMYDKRSFQVFEANKEGRDCAWVTVISEQTDIHEVVSKADAFYGDGGCLALEMSLAGKPVMIQDVRY